MPQTAFIKDTAHSLAIDHLGIAETLVAQLSAISKLAEPDSAIHSLASHSLGLVSGLHNDFDAAVEAQH